MKSNIIESVEFLVEEDLLIAELDKRLSFTALADTRVCVGVSVCGCLIHKDDYVPQNGTAGVRG